MFRGKGVFCRSVREDCFVYTFAESMHRRLSRLAVDTEQVRDRFVLNLMFKQCAFVYNNAMSCCQDRLGTEKRKRKLTKNARVFLPAVARCCWRGGRSSAQQRCDTMTLFLLFRHLFRCYATRSLTKTGSGQTYEKATNERPFSVISQHQHQHQQHQGRLEWRHRRS